MQIEESELSSKFTKPTTWEAVRASRIRLLRSPPVDFARLPLRVACSLRLAENHEGAPCVRIDYFVEALWSPPGAEPGWSDITRIDLRPEDDEAARVLFGETEDEACVIDAAIERVLGLHAGALHPRRALCAEASGAEGAP